MTENIMCKHDYYHYFDIPKGWHMIFKKNIKYKMIIQNNIFYINELKNSYETYSGIGLDRDMFNTYFYTEKELRKLKIDKLNDK